MNQSIGSALATNSSDLSSDQALATLAWLQDENLLSVMSDQPSAWSDLDSQGWTLRKAAQPRQTVAAPSLQFQSGTPPPLVRAQPRSQAVTQDLDTAAEQAKALASSCESLEDLEKAVRDFEGFPFKRLAKHTVFSDGQPDAGIMFVGEAPGTDEDRVGRPFVGASGQLLDRMINSIGLDRATNAYISNLIFWRPPGNRTPTVSEVAVCEPFTRRHIALVKPKLLVFLGGMPATTLTGTTEGITRQRGKWQVYTDPEHGLEIPAMPLLHPVYLLRQPKAKRETWMDLLSLQQKLRETGGLQGAEKA